MERACDACGTQYQAKRKTSRYCSDRCRMRSLRNAPAERPRLRVVSEEPVVIGDVAVDLEHATILGAVLAELAEARAANTALARMAISHAKVLDDPYSKDTASARAALSRELRAILTEIGAVKPAAKNPLELLRARHGNNPNAG